MIERDSPELNVWCAVMHDRIIELAEANVNSIVYLDMLELYFVPQLQELQRMVIFQSDDAPPHWGLNVTNFLNLAFSSCWIGRDGLTECQLVHLI